MKQELQFHTQAEIENFARMISLWARPSQLIRLSGELGAGKSTFARAFIKALAKPDDQFDVPSPSFSLIQAYDNLRIPVAHIDLYRLSNVNEVSELGIFELLATHTVLVEWPGLLDNALTDDTLSLTFSGTGESRKVILEAGGSWRNSLRRSAEIEQFLATTSWKKSERAFLEGDASSRRYEVLNLNHKNTILMDMPHRPDGPPVKDGKPYSAIAHLAEGMKSVVEVNQQLVDFGYSAAKIETHDLDAGLALIEDLGSRVYGRMILAGEPMDEPMQEAVAVLADMTTKVWPSTLPKYDSAAQLIEVDLLPSWFWPHIHGSSPGSELNASFEKIWLKILPLSEYKDPHWVMRDYHSPNLIWIPERSGLSRVGLIDTQDAVLGHPAYDLASLLQDARVDIDFAWADELYRHYEVLRQEQGNFDAKQFKVAYAVLGAQRATKILGIFARLAKRDGKPAYLKHMPRVSRYLARNLEHPALNELKDWYQQAIPEALTVGQS
jgi:N-acetylmuramate 1-kinase